ncbi:MAG TPA: hypothetical protein VMX18_01770 [Candidatus Bipolaricaulota bacterium]|nr:hypothetical protein [Candidatus Bipolaricaulota bacterium]
MWSKRDKKNDGKRDNIYLIGVVVIFIAGFVIYFANLNKPENPDAEDPAEQFYQFATNQENNPFYRFKLMQLAEAIKVKVKASEAPAEEALAPGIYFSEYFLKENPAETYNNIKDFLSDIDASADLKISDLAAKNCFDINIGVEDREKTLIFLKAEDDVKELNAMEPPIWRICYKTAYYPEQLSQSFASYDINFAESEEKTVYIAKAEGDWSESFLSELESTYSDVIKIQR